MPQHEIRVPTHSAIRISDGKTTLWFDPFNLDSACHDADVIFVTHAHYDHFSPNDIGKVRKGGTVFVMPSSMADEAATLADEMTALASEAAASDGETAALAGEAVALDSEAAALADERAGGNLPVHFMEAGQEIDVAGVSVRAIAAYNRDRAFHPRDAGWLGYVVTLDGRRYYVAGDTDDTPEARKVCCDVALVPVGGTYTMDATQAARLVNALRPAQAVPTHYGTVAGTPEDGAAFAAAVGANIEVNLLVGT